jgi:hypothetical protein
MLLTYAKEKGSCFSPQICTLLWAVSMIMDLSALNLKTISKVFGGERWFIREETFTVWTLP